MRITLFGTSKMVEADVDQFLDKLSDTGILFEQTIKYYFAHGADDSFEAKVTRLIETEKSANELARKIGRELYTHMLIPDLRADVLSLIQDLDYIADHYAKIATQFDIERPYHTSAPKGSNKIYNELVETCVKCVEATVHSARAFFKDISAVEDHTHKVSFYESEVDEIAVRLKRSIFGAPDLPLEQKLQYRYFVDVLDELADDAEDVSEWISIYAIKRSL